jgi:hypothetical protein
MIPIRLNFSIRVRGKVRQLVAESLCPPDTVFPDQEVVSKLAEIDMIVADLERANSRVATVERRNVRTISLLRVSLISELVTAGITTR